MDFTRLLLCGAVMLSVGTSVANAAIQESDCPVCFSIVNRLYAEVTKDGGTATADNVSEAFLRLCETAKKDSVDEKFCYYMGGQEVSATRTYKEMAKRMGFGIPVEKICESLQGDSAICELKERKPIDLKTVDLKKLKVADLKRLLKDRGEQCEGCFEKSEFIKKVEDIKAREEL